MLNEERCYPDCTRLRFPRGAFLSFPRGDSEGGKARRKGREGEDTKTHALTRHVSDVSPDTFLSFGVFPPSPFPSALFSPFSPPPGGRLLSSPLRSSRRCVFPLFVFSALPSPPRRIRERLTSSSSFLKAYRSSLVPTRYGASSFSCGRRSLWAFLFFDV